MAIDTIPMTSIEAIVYQYLTERKIPFSFQSSLMGGWYSLGGAVVDFILEENMIALRVAGEYWHAGVEKRGSDLIQKELLANLGYTVIDLWEDDIKNRLEETMRLTLQGQEMLH